MGNSDTMPAHYVRYQGGFVADSRRPLTRLPYFLIIEEGLAKRRITATAITGTSGKGLGLSPLRIEYTAVDGSSSAYDAFNPAHVSILVVLAQEPGFREGDRIMDHTGSGQILAARLEDDGLWSYLIREFGEFCYPGDQHWSREWQITTPPPARD